MEKSDTKILLELLRNRNFNWFIHIFIISFNYNERYILICFKWWWMGIETYFRKNEKHIVLELTDRFYNSFFVDFD